MAAHGRSRLAVGATVALAAVLAGGCGSDDADDVSELGGRIELAAGDTSYPFAQAAAEQFQIEHPDVTITVERASTRAALARLCGGEADLAASPRSIGRRESRACAQAGIAYDESELPSDGIGEPVHLHTSERAREDPAVDALAEFVAAHHAFIADAAARGRRALSRSAPRG